MNSRSFPEKRICMIAYSEYFSDSRIRREAETLAANGWDVSVLMLPQSKRAKPEVLNNVRAMGVNMRKYRGYGLTSYFISYINFFLHSLVTCSMLTLKGQVDIIHVHNMPDFLVFAAILPRILGRKIILDIHDSMLETYAGKFGKLPKWLYWLLFLEEKISAAFVHRIICVNHVQIRPLLQRGIPEKKITVLMNVPDHKIFNLTVRADPSADPEHYNIVYHGTLDRALGIDLALHAVNRIRKDIPSVRFYIIGKGKDQEAFAALIKDLHLESNVSLQTKLFQVQEMPKVLHTMHIGLISNRNNGATRYMLPVKLLEYVSLGIPAVAPALDPIRYYFDETMVSYYEPENLDDMVRAIRNLCNNPKTRRQQADNAFKMLDKYGWNTHQQDLLNLYAGLINKRTS
jgi:glycosyltransferase involved in cell wall biosynthesis